jgi:hypothetical protein
VTIDDIIPFMQIKG